MRRKNVRIYLAKQAVRKGHFSIRKAIERYHVPKSTLHDHLNLSVKRGRKGRPPALYDDEEQILS